MSGMKDKDAANRLAAARASLADALSFPDLLAKLSARDRGNAERRVTVLDAAGHADRSRAWQRLACALMTLAPVAKFVGKSAVEFFVPDGKYKMQAYALEDMDDGNVTVYGPDVLAEAVEAGLLKATKLPEPMSYAVASTGEPLSIHALDGSVLNPEAHVKNLTNWKRKAVRIALPQQASKAQLEAAELLCALAAQHFLPGIPAE